MTGPVGVLLAKLRTDLRHLRSDPSEWFVLAGNRLLVAGLLTALFAVVVVALVVTKVVIIANTGQMIYLAQGLLTGTLTLVTIVLAINQLVLSREFGTPGELEDQIRSVMGFRQDVAETTGKNVLPATPTHFFTVLLDGTRRNAQRLGGAVEGDDRLREEVDALASTITADIDGITGGLDRAEQDVFNTLAVSLETNFAGTMNEARRLQAVYGDELSDPALEVLDDLIESLLQVDIARQYLKSIYIQSELAQLSRLLLYAGLPTVAGAIVMFLLYVTGPNEPVASDYLAVFVVVEVVFAFSLMAILFSFVLRTATVAQRTVAITPFTRPSTDISLGAEDDRDEPG